MNANSVDCNRGNLPWSELFLPAVEKIYSFLNRRDQRNMSLVCRNWLTVYRSPSLWRRFEFFVPDDRNKTGLCPDVISAWSYGDMFHHVTIFFCDGDIEPPFCWNISPAVALHQLKFFMKALTCKSQLLSISFQNMENSYFGMADEAAKAEVYQALMNFIKSQKKLQYVEFSNCSFKKLDATEILKAICANNFKTLRHLEIRDFVDYETDGEFTVDEDLNFHVFMNLEILSIDYSLVFEEMMVSFYEYRNRKDMRERQGCLKNIKLFFEDRVNLRLDPLVWQYFIIFFPGLTIDLTAYGNLFSICLIIVPKMRLRSAAFILRSDEQNGEIGLLLRHITSCRINECLEELKIYCYLSPSFAADLISFTNVCPKLKSLKLETEHPVEALDTVFNSWIERRPESLDVVQITVEEVPTAEEKTAYTNLNDFFAPLLQVLGIELSISAELVDPDHIDSLI